MNIKIKLPPLGATVVEATVVVWLNQPGEQVSHGEPSVEVMTAKPNVEIPAPASGVLLDQLVEEGAVIEPGAAIGTIRT